MPRFSCVFSRPRSRSNRRVVPSWVCRLLAYTERVAERLRRVDWSEFRPFEEVEAVQNILRRIAGELQRHPPATSSPEDAVRRRAPFLPAARQAVARGRLDELRHLRPHLHDDAVLFFNDDGGIAPVVEATFFEAMRHAVWAAAMLVVRELPDGAEKADKSKAVRARADREMCRWGPGRRRFITQKVLGVDGAPVIGSDTEIKALEDHWGAIFGGEPELDDAACAHLLRHCPVVGRAAVVDLLSFREFCQAACRARDSSLGPDGGHGDIREATGYGRGMSV